MAKLDRGKVFEGEMTQAFRRGGCPFVLRIKDGAQSKGKTTQNPADILVCSKDNNLLIECKAVKGTSIPFDRVKPHQRTALVKFSKIGVTHTGAVAVLFYNGKLGKQRMYRAFLIEANVWTRTQKVAKRGRLGRKRKSLPMGWLTNGEVKNVEIEWTPGVGWDTDRGILRYPSWQ